jgi:hypothetical protein
MFCANCACELPAIAKFCVRCGSRVETSIKAVQLPPVTSQTSGVISERIAHCSKCGAQNPGDFLFCTFCGTSLAPIVRPVPDPLNARASIPTDSPTLGHSDNSSSYVPQIAEAEYVNSPKAELSDSSEASQRVSARGNILVVCSDSRLPPFCVKCGNPSVEPWVRQTFSWHHPGYYILLISPIIYAIVALIARKRVKVAIPLCQSHKSIRKKRLWIAAVLLLGCIPVPAMFASYISNEAADNLAVVLGLGMFIAGLCFLAFAPPLKPTNIDSSGAHLKGACPEFLARIRSTG